MEDALKKLQEIGIEEVARVTHISYAKLDAIIHKRFNELDRTITQGFIRILEREYGVDLSAWMEEYREFYDELHSDDPDEDKVFVAAKEEKSGKSFLLWLVVLVLLIGGGWYLFQNKEQVLPWFDSEKDASKGSFHSASEADLSSSSLAASFQKFNHQIKEAQENSQKAMDVADDQAAALAVEENDQNETEATPVVQSNDKDENVSLAADETEVAEALPEPSVKEVRIEPKARMWVGIIHLDTRTKEDFTTEETINVPLESPLLLVTGHGDATLVVDDNRTYLNRQNPVRFYYDGERFRMVSVAEFLKLNRGDIW